MTQEATQQGVQSILGDLENLWQGIDQMLDALGPDDWSTAHGPDWTFADVPYHLGYFDRELIARAIEQGPDLPAADQDLWGSFNDLNAWNEQMFAQRPAGQTPAESVGQMRAGRDDLRRVAGAMSDADLERPTWVRLFGGWLNAGMAMTACCAHTWNHHEELRMRLERSAPQPSAPATHRALSLYTTLIPYVSLDRDQAANQQFTSVMDFTGPGGGAWTVRVADGGCSCEEGRAADADVVMTQSPESFVKSMTGLHDPAAAMQSGEIAVEGMENMERYGALFPPIDPARAIPPMGPTAL